MAFNIFKSKQQRGAEKRTKSLKKHIKERKKDVDILKTYKRGGKITGLGPQARLTRLLGEIGQPIKRDEFGRKIK